MNPTSTDRQESFATRVYSVVFPVILFGLLGGGFSAWAGQSALAQADREARGDYVRDRDRRGFRPFLLFHWLGIRDWRTQFAVGAAIGSTLTVLWIRKSNREARETEARDQARDQG